MKIAETSIARPVLAAMMTVALVVFGITAYRNIGVDLFPDVEFPIVTVTVPYPGADPETVETEVTDKIEEAVNTIAGIKTMRSESLEGLAQIFIEFELEENVDIVSQDVRDKVAGVRGDLPLEIDPPIVEKFDVNSSPILSIALSGTAPIRDLTRYADEVIKPQIEGISGVGNVRLVGDRDREVRVWLRQEALESHGLSATDVTDALKNENLEPPGGRVETATREMIVKTKGKVPTVDRFEGLIVANRAGTAIRLRDVAWVEDGLEDFRSLSRLNGKRAVSLLVRRQSGENMVAVADKVKQELERIEARMPQGYELTMAQDLSVFVEKSVREARRELINGGMLATVVILLFLRSLRASFVAAITIPTTIISTFTLMAAMGFTVNMMTMLALTVSVGMVVDDAIVVLENTYRHMEEGMPRIQAAIAGIREIGFAVVATSLAVGAVFVPVAFMEGIVGRFFFEFGLTVAFTVFVSTFLAVTLSPMLCSRVLTCTQKHGRVFNALERAFQAVERFYRWALATALRHRVLVVLGAFGVFLSSLAITPFIGKEFLPEEDESQFNVQVQTPVGTSIHATSRILEEIEHRLGGLPCVTDVFTTVGAGVEERVNVATVLVKLVPLAERSLSQKQIMTMARHQLSDLGHLKLSVEIVPRVGGGGFRHAPVQYAIRGGDMDKLVEVSGEMREKMQELPGLVDVNSTYDPTKPEVRVIIDRDKAKDLALSVSDIGSAVYTLIGGRKVSTFEEAGETFDVRVRLAEADRNRPETILDVPVRNDRGQLIPLRSVVRVEEGTGPVQIDRQDRARQIVVLANLQGAAPGEEPMPLATALDKVAQMETQIGLPDGVDSKFVGEGEMMDESFDNINFSLMLAVVLIYMVLAAQFESLIHPFTVMLSLPLSIVGALGLLALTGRTLNIFSMIGMIMLAGLVTKNAILLIDYTNLLRSQGLDKSAAILKAGPTRLRPILMTAMTTITGMIPVAIGLGEGAATRAPLGTTIVGGMTTSTVLTLIVVPVVYSLLDDAGAFVTRLFFRRKEATPLAPQPPARPATAEVAAPDTVVLGETLTGIPAPPSHRHREHPPSEPAAAER